MGAFRYCRVALLLALSRSSAVDAVGKSERDYCIVGAGPAGIQLGYLLGAANRDYVVLERNSVAGSFFTVNPRHRTFISTNKRFTGRDNPEFNMRHDWNSLLSDPPFLFGSYSDKYFPPADDYVRYLHDFAEHHNVAISYDTSVGSITPKDGKSVIETSNGQLTCKYVVIATGLSLPHLPNIGGMEHVTGYEEMSINVKDYTNKSVLILGKGQSAFETAKHIYGEVAHIDMFSRHAPRVAFQTHYVGDIRAINAEMFDAYQLKSVDTIQESDLSKFGPFIKRDDGKIMLEKPYGDQELFRYDEDGPLLDADGSRPFDWWDVVIRCTGWEFDRSIFSGSGKPMMSTGAISYKYPAMTPSYRSKNVPNTWFSGTLAHGLDWRKSSGGFIHGFRYTARALARVLGVENHGEPWPSVDITDENWSGRTDESQHYRLATSILHRCNEMSGPYQMFGKLVELYVFTEEGRTHRFEEVPIGYIPEVMAALPPSIKSTGYMTGMFQYGKGYSGEGVNTLAGSRVVRPHAVDNIENGPGFLQNFIHPVFRHNCYDDKSCMETETLPYHLGEDIHTTYTRPVFDVQPFSRYLERINALGSTLTEAPVPKKAAKQKAASKAAEPEARPASAPTATVGAPPTAALLEAEQVRQNWLPSLEPATQLSGAPLPTPVPSAAEPVAAEPAGEPSLAARQAHADSPCEEGEVELWSDTCAPVPIAYNSPKPGSQFQYRQQVPFLFKDATSEIQQLLPWLHDYVMSREADWLQTPMDGGAAQNDPRLFAHRESFNVLTSGRTSSEREKLAAITDFVSEALLDFLREWQDPANSNLDGAAKVWQPYVRAAEWNRIPMVIAECWATIDRPGSEKWAEYHYEGPLDHPYPFQGELHISAEPSHTAYRAPFNEEVFVNQAKNGRLEVLPGGIRRSSSDWAGEQPRVALRFNMDIRSRVECRIPLVMDWCMKQMSTHFAQLVGRAGIQELNDDGDFMAIDVRHQDLAALYSSGPNPQVL
jgi:thioredoxin reductase